MEVLRRCRQKCAVVNSNRRWLNADPLGLAGGLNLYRYVGNSPLGNVDPMGLLSVPVKGGFHPNNGPWNSADTAAILIPALPLTAFGLPLEAGAANILIAANLLIDAIRGHHHCPDTGPLIATVKDTATTTGFRAVNLDELINIHDNNAFAPSPTGSLNKCFSLNLDQAVSFGERIEGAGNYGVVKGVFPTSAVGDPINPATEGPGFVVPNENLPKGTPTIMIPPDL